MSKYFEISGYWKDTKDEFEGLLIKEFEDVLLEEDDGIFYYGLSESDLKEAVELVEDTIHDFVITSFKDRSGF